MKVGGWGEQSRAVGRWVLFCQGCIGVWTECVFHFSQTWGVMYIREQNFSFHFWCSWEGSMEFEEEVDWSERNARGHGFQSVGLTISIAKALVRNTDSQPPHHPSTTTRLPDSEALGAAQPSVFPQGCQAFYGSPKLRTAALSGGLEAGARVVSFKNGKSRGHCVHRKNPEDKSSW